ncbi:hypothetical protein MGAST_12260 [Mycobacterium gastri 'Wayne']|uniref:Mutator family transposase n=1 Tax=Mycobacterium gastri TaxID=1777 RepID=A0A1X1UTC2_MYCGS|nr:hypothetical protein MGAST_12260 [Mycobacterium gastri 'Wayne']ORV60092.1 hypothetical protein AWC07_18960 [Mycobacterium gastri]
MQLARLQRGLACPLLVISDGAPGLIGAVERTTGAALRQRCLIRRARNLLALSLTVGHNQIPNPSRLMWLMGKSQSCPTARG